MSWRLREVDNNPQHWLGDAPGVQLGASGLRLRAQRLTQACTTPREQACALFEHVSQMPFGVIRISTRCQPAHQHRLRKADAYAKATLWVHLLRLCEIPARMRWVRLDATELTRGLWDFCRHVGQPFFYPLTEVFLEGRWLVTDAYIMDPLLFRAIQLELGQQRWTAGYFVHAQGQCGWDGQADAFQRFSPSDPASLPVEDFGCFHSHADFLARVRPDFRVTAVAQMAFVSQSVLMGRAFKRLRAEGR